MRSGFILIVTTALLVFLFGYTAVSKLLSFDQFKNTLSRSPWIKSFASLVAYGLSVSELIVSVLLLMPATRYSGLRLSLVLLCLMTIYIVAMVLTSSHLPCACGGVISQLGWKGHIVFNSFFIFINVIALIIYKRQEVSRKPEIE
jgi:uncharacterized membrane protein